MASILLIVSGIGGCAFDDTETALHYYGSRCDLSEVVTALDGGADPNEEDSDGVRPLARAIEGANAGVNLVECGEVVEVLVSAGADPSALDSDGGGPAFWAIVGPNQPKILEYIDPTTENWCNVPSWVATNILDLAEDDAEWNDQGVAAYLIDC